MSVNPYDPPKEFRTAWSGARRLPRVHKIAWLVVITFPTLFLAVLFAADALGGASTEVPGSGALIYWLPTGSVVVASLIVVLSPASLLAKATWLSLSVVAGVLLFALDILIFGLLALAMNGMSGIQ